MHPVRAALPRQPLAPSGPSGRTASVDPLAAQLGRVTSDPRAVAHLHVPGREGRTADWPGWVHADVRDAYLRMGIARPWVHQVRAAAHAWQRQHVVIATGTASGKSAAFGMPALTTALEATPKRGTRGPGVLYLSPTKALAHDQLAGLGALAIPGLRAAAVDGDTPDEQRAWARAHARWIVTNPDMLHRTILPRHEQWRGFLRALRFVVVDEAHTYRGVFGSHVALVLRRLSRLASLHGASPTFIAASATVSEPGDTAQRLLGVEVEVVDVDASERGAMDIVLWNPGGPRTLAAAEPTGGPLPDHPVDRGTLAEAADLMAGLVDANVTTLTFARSRRAVEVVAGTVRERATNGALVRAYRGGYLPEERRALEADLRSGRLLGLAATNALELGIDISGLGAVVLVGWPGTRSSFWQQVGRAGRRGESAMAVLIAREDPLDQYMVSHPDMLIGGPVEASVFDPSNPYVLAGHLCAAASESALRHESLVGTFGPGAVELCEVLGQRGLLRRRSDGWYWTDASRAVDLVDLRGTGGGPVRVVEQGTGRLLGTVDTAAAPSAAHKGALYVHQGATFEVVSLDLESRVAEAAATVTDLSTHARSSADVAFHTVRATTSWGRVHVSSGDVVVTRQVMSYLVRRWPAGQVVASHALDLPPTILSTMAMWWTIPGDVLAAAEIPEDTVPGAVHALEHAAIGMLPLLATCDRWDLGGVSTARHPQVGQAVIVVHDGYPGGAGFAQRGFERALEWLSATRDAIAHCACLSGCPACVQSPKCGNGNEPLDKGAALRLAAALIKEHEASA